MIWYLLYPIRGTTEAPVLAPTHPVRVAVTRYARLAARHVVTTLLVSVAVAAALLYPIPFLYSSDFTNAASNLPHHVWTNAQPLRGQSAVVPDVIMRSIWVHGSYMEALDRDVLLRALKLQDELLGPTKDFSPRRPPAAVAELLATRPADLPPDLSPEQRDAFHIINGPTNQSWFFHSPLQYWSGDAARIAADPDIVATVNERKTQPTSVNVTLRHSTVFSGKRFEDRRLIAADALVITLTHMRDSPIGRRWEARAEALAAAAADTWTTYPSDGRSMPSQLYEFQFLPISLRDSVLLIFAYLLTVVYFMMSLSRLRAVKSRPGLILTVMAQIFCSIMSSFTLCAIFKIDLSRMPQAAYPIVVVSISLENMFRLINAVLVTRSEDSSSARIGHAFGATTHIAAASVAQNLLILGTLAYVVPVAPISAFCAFAAVASVFDFFYLSTFFLAVLSVEVRRTELSEALERSASRQRHGRSASAPAARQSWTEAVLQGKTDVSTRIAGTIVMSGFLLIAYWHFGDEGVPRTVSWLLNLLAWPAASDGQHAPKSSLLVEVHQARSPTSWLRLQDHETAHEVIQVVKPWAHSYVARVYDPLVLVLKGSDRMPSVAEPVLLPAVYDFFRHQSKPFLVTVGVVVAAVRILMNYLLWDEMADAGRGGPDDSEDEPLLTVKTLNGAHTLDVAKMTASPSGLVVSVGLDRMVQVVDVGRLGLHMRSCVVADTRRPVEALFPILAMAIDDDSIWLAMLSRFKVCLWSLPEQRWGPSMAVDLCGERPEAFFFTPSALKDRPSLSLIVVRKNGTMAELWPHRDDYTDSPICKSPLMAAVPLVTTSTRPSTAGSVSILTASRRGCIHHVTMGTDRWISTEVQLSMASGKDIHSLLAIPLLSAYLVGRSRSADLVDVATSSVVRTFETEPMQPRSLRYSYSSKQHSQWSPVGLSYFSVAYTSADSGDCVVQTCVPQREGALVCSCPPSQVPNKFCCAWDEALETAPTHLSDPGTWEALPNGCLVGIRRKKAARPSPPPPPPTGGGLRGRRSKNSSPQSPGGSTSAPDGWEVWSMSHLDKEGGDCEAVLLDEAEGWDRQRRQPPSCSEHLLISELGPMVKVGTSSVAVGFGNVVKVISIGHGRFGSPSEMLEPDGSINVGSRKRRTAGLSRSRLGGGHGA